MSQSTTKLEALPAIRGAHRLHRIINKDLRLPRTTTDSVVRCLKFARNPAQKFVRSKYARALQSSAQPKVSVPERTGLLAIDDTMFPHATTALDTARHLFEALRDDGTAERMRQQAGKDFLVSVVKDTEFAEHPDILNLMISREMLETVSAYFGSVPVLSAASLWWTPPNASVQQSQLYHRDAEDQRQLKVFFNLTDVSEEAGPLTYFDAQSSSLIRDKIGYSTVRLDDETVEAFAGTTQPAKATGPSGSGLMLDTSRCLHYGSRGNKVERLVLMFQFTSFYAPKSRWPDWASALSGRDIALDDLQRLALGVA